MTDDLLARLANPTFPSIPDMMDAAKLISKLETAHGQNMKEIDKLNAELAAARELLHKLTAIIPGNDGAGKDVAEFLARTKGGGDE